MSPYSNEWAETLRKLQAQCNSLSDEAQKWKDLYTERATAFDNANGQNLILKGQLADQLMKAEHNRRCYDALKDELESLKAPPAIRPPDGGDFPLVQLMTQLAQVQRDVTTIQSQIRTIFGGINGNHLEVTKRIAALEEGKKPCE
jgi:hypothetical protein